MPRKPTSKSRPATRQWRITLIRKKGQYLGLVEAPDTETAVTRAIEHFDIDEAHRKRLIAEPIEE